MTNKTGPTTEIIFMTFSKEYEFLCQVDLGNNLIEEENFGGGL